MPDSPHTSTNRQSTASQSQPRDAAATTTAPLAAPVLQFVTATNPDQFRERSTMRRVRRGVMRDYLQRAESDPNCTDIRVARSKNRRSSSRRAEAESSTHDPGNLLRPSTSAPAQHVPAFSDPSSTHDPESSRRSPHIWMTQQLRNDHVKIQYLKECCTRYFATPAMIRKWAPLIVQAPEAFLSTLCIASPYVDMMTISNQTLPTSDSAQTLAIRHEVIRRIQESLTDPNRRIDDLTIITVLQLLTGDVISANTQTLHVHELGLLNMIKERGGLEQLGGDGHIACSVVVTNLDLAIMHDRGPDAIYSSYARASIAATHTPTSLQMPFFDIALSRACPATIVHIMSLVKSVTTAFVQLHETQQFAGYFPDPLSVSQTDLLVIDLHSQIQQLVDRVYALPAASVGLEGSYDGAYEACRLTALLYTTSIWHKTTFRMAATDESIAIPAAEHVDTSPRQIRDALVMTDLSTCWKGWTSVLYWITLVAVSACGEPKYGVSTSTAASPLAQNPRSVPWRIDTDVGAIESRLDEESVAQHSTALQPFPQTHPSSLASLDPQDAIDFVTRRWLVAISVRCSILLRFEHTAGVLSSLEQLLAVQRILRGEDGFFDTGIVAGRNDSVM